MRVIRSSWLVGVGVLALTVIAGESSAVDEPSPATFSGAALYAQYCSSCHGPDGRGKTPLAELFHVSPPDLTRIAERREGWFPEVLVREIIDGRFVAHGGREMPI